MLFNSHLFLFFFLPLILIGFRVAGAFGGMRAAMAWLVVGSLVFYGFWNPAYLLLLGLSIVVNYGLGHLQARRHLGQRGPSKLITTLGIVFNVGLIAWFKYANFMVDSLNGVAGQELIDLAPIALPLAISFFTFQQIAYLVDTHYGTTKDYTFLQYCLFVVFFPQLIAGPIVHHREVLPQFAKAKPHIRAENLTIGLSLLIIGLFKKVVIADKVAGDASAVFMAAEQGTAIGLFEAWGGVLAYTVQLYFDFSGYSDMAIGLARCFGITLPANFNSPYKATSIVDFWNRWHITLSRFLRDYLFFPLCGKRPGPVRRQISIFLTMVLGGLWHGAGWTFVVWGAMHGTYLVINHLWRELTGKWGWGAPGKSLTFFYWALTFFAFVMSLVFFRAETFGGAWNIMSSMFVGELSLPESWGKWQEVPKGEVASLGPIVFAGTGAFATSGWGKVILGLILALMLPNSQQIMRNANPVLGRIEKVQGWRSRIAWTPAWYWALFITILAIAALLNLTQVSEFLYWQF